MIEANDRYHTMKSIFGMLTILTALVFVAACSKAPAAPPPEMTELVDRAAIEDLFNDYYSQFGLKSQHDFVSYFTANGRLEVNGLVANNPDEIKAMYAQAGVGSEGKAQKA